MESILLDLFQDFLVLLLLLSLPFVGSAFVAGVVTGILGMVSRLSDPAVGVSLRLLTGFGTLVLVGPLLASHVISFSTDVWGLMSQVVSDSVL